MKLEELKEETTKDLKIDLLDMQGMAAGNCLLHNKYLKLYTEQRIQLKKLLLEQFSIRKRRYRFYMGYEKECHDEILSDRGLKIYLEGDDELLEHQKKIIIVEEKIKFLEETLSSIVARGFNIRNVIEQRKIEIGI